MEGYWTLSHLKLVIEVPKIPGSLSDLEDKESIWATLVALAYFKKYYKSHKSEWKLIADKARRWLKTKNIEESFYEIAEKTIS
jgi:hypothetical protein